MEDVPESLTKSQHETVARINDFAFNLSKQIERTLPEDGFVCSPMSMAYLLGMLCDGASGETREEICRTLGVSPDDKKAVNDLLRAIMVISAKGIGSDEVLEVSNIAVVNHDFELLKPYKESIKAYYDADVASLNFADNDYVVGYINDWAVRKTHGKIRDLACEIDPQTRAIFMNAIYFKAGWADGFYSEFTQKGNFTAEDGNHRVESIMRKTADMALYRGDQYSVLEIPYGKTDENNNLLPPPTVPPCKPVITHWMPIPKLY